MALQDTIGLNEDYTTVNVLVIHSNVFVIAAKGEYLNITNYQFPKFRPPLDLR
jgi:hypothetical protein